MIASFLKKHHNVNRGGPVRNFATIPRMDKLSGIVRELEQQRARIDAALRALTGASNTRSTARTGRRTLSAAARRKIAAAQRARWAKWKAARKK
jgi:hypothetical protein